MDRSGCLRPALRFNLILHLRSIRHNEAMQMLSDTRACVGRPTALTLILFAASMLAKLASNIALSFSSLAFCLSSAFSTSLESHSGSDASSTLPQKEDQGSRECDTLAPQTDYGKLVRQLIRRTDWFASLQSSLLASKAAFFRCCLRPSSCESFNCITRSPISSRALNPYISSVVSWYANLAIDGIVSSRLSMHRDITAVLLSQRRINRKDESSLLDVVV